MAIDFPNTPTSGQTFTVGDRTWSFDGTKWNTVSTGNSGVRVFASAADRSSVILTPTEGMVSYLRDVDQTQQFNGTSWEGLVTTTNVGSLAPQGNAVINGGFDIWQRGTSSTTNVGYGSADRWAQYYAAGTATFAQESTIVPAGSQYAMKITQSGATSASSIIQTAIETKDALKFAGKTVTVSAEFASSTTQIFTYSLAYSTNVDQGIFLAKTSLSDFTGSVSSTTYSRKTFTCVIPPNAKTLFLIVTVTNIAAGTSFYVGNVQLEAGTVATPFKRNAPSIQAELAACQRYYQKSIPVDSTPGTSEARGRIFLDNISTITRDIRWPQLWTVTMRSTPTITVYNVTGGAPSPAVNNDNTGSSGTLFYSSLASSATNQFQWTASAEL